MAESVPSWCFAENRLPDLSRSFSFFSWSFSLLLEWESRLGCPWPPAGASDVGGGASAGGLALAISQGGCRGLLVTGPFAYGSHQHTDHWTTTKASRPLEEKERRGQTARSTPFCPATEIGNSTSLRRAFSVARRAGTAGG